MEGFLHMPVFVIESNVVDVARDAKSEELRDAPAATPKLCAVQRKCNMLG